MIVKWITGVALLCCLSVDATVTQFRFGDGKYQASKECDKESPGEFTASQDAWTLAYKFPKLTYGYGERAAEHKISFPLTDAMQNAKVFSLSLYNDTETGHAFMIRLTGEGGIEWNSPPVIMNGEKQWREVAFDLSSFINFQNKDFPIPNGKISSVSLVVQQTITSKLASLGVARSGMVKFKDFAADAQPGNLGKTMFFNGELFVPESDKIGKSGQIPLVLTRNGLSKSYPARSGIPFARGTVYDSKKLRFLENGNEIPAGFDEMSRYSDGSLRAIRLSALIDLSGKKQYALEYGNAVRKEEPGAKLAEKKDADGSIIVDTGTIRAEFIREGNSILQSLQLDGKKMLTDLTAVFGTESALSKKKIDIESNNAMETVVVVSGTFADGGYSFRSRFVFIRGCNGVPLTFTFINRDGKAYDSVLPDVSLSGKWGKAATHWSFGKFQEFSDKKIMFFQDGAHYRENQRNYPGILSEDGKVLQEVNSFDGVWHIKTADGTVGCGIIDAWMNNPKTVELSSDAFTIGLSSSKSIYSKGKCQRTAFFKGMAKTHRLILSFNAPDMAADFVKHPLLTASPAYLCGSGVFGDIAPVNDKKFPLFESVASNWTGDRFATNCYFGDMYNMRDFGDWGNVRQGAVWNNLETGGGMAFLIQFVRSGNPSMLDNAYRSILHYIDIDTCHADIDPKVPGRTVGAVFAHRPDHVASPENPATHDLKYLGVSGHDWYLEVAWMYLLTGEEVFREASLFHAEATVRAIEQTFNPSHILAREYAWPLKNLVAFHMLNPDPRYLKAAAKVMNFFAFWRNAFGSGRLGNTLGQPGVCLEAIAYYYRETGDPQAAELLKTATKTLVAGTYISPENGLPSDSLYNEDSRMMFLNGLTAYYRLTGDKKMVERFVPYLYFHLRHPESLCDSTIPWCSPEFIKIMDELNLKEPVSKPSMHVWNSWFSKPDDKGRLSAELRFCDKVDASFSITVSRIAAMRLGGLTRGLVVGDWQGYPCNLKNELKSSEPELERTDYGTITVTDPSGKEILRKTIPHYYSGIYTFDVPKDGQSGIYRIQIMTDDKINLAFAASSSRPGLALINRDGMPWMQDTYIPVVTPDEKFSAIVTQRRANTPGGARLSSPVGKVTELFNNPDQESNSKAVFQGQGKGVWKLERSMLNTLSYMVLQGIEPLVCPSVEDAQVFVDYGPVPPRKQNNP